MSKKRIYIPIGLCIAVLCTIGFLSLLSEVPEEPIKIYKATWSTEKPTKVTTPVSFSQATETSLTETSLKYPDLSTMTEEELDRENEELDMEIAEIDSRKARKQAEHERLIASQEVEIARLRRLIAEAEAETEAVEELYDYLQSTAARLNTEYPDFVAFRDKYPDPTADDIMREYPDEEERQAFLVQVMEADDIYREMADRILNTPAMLEHLSPLELEILNRPSMRELVGGLLE